MKRLLVLFLSLLALSSGLIALPLYPQLPAVNLPLINGHKLELNFYAPKEALPFFDASILQKGFAKLSANYKLTNDFTVSFVPGDTGTLGFIVTFDGLDSGLSNTLYPRTNAIGLHGLPLVAPRDALEIVNAWYKSYLANPSQDKSDSFVSSIRKTTFIVDYYATSPITGGGLQLAMHGSFQGNTPVFDPKMEIMQLDLSLTTYHIALASSDNLQALQSDYFYVLDPIDDSANPGLKRESVFVYVLFGLPLPQPVKTGTMQAGSAGTTSATKSVYNVGDTGPAGGIIFYDKGKASDGWRYLEAAPSDQSAGIQWHNRDYCYIKTSTAIGTGKANTEAIIAAQGDGSYAAALCKNLTINGFSDWFLPSKDELALMYTNLKKAGLGGFGKDGLWSSSQFNDNFAACEQSFSDGNQVYTWESWEYSVRACRAF